VNVIKKNFQSMAVVVFRP